MMHTHTLNDSAVPFLLQPKCFFVYNFWYVRKRTGTLHCMINRERISENGNKYKEKSGLGHRNASTLPHCVHFMIDHVRIRSNARHICKLDVKPTRPTETTPCQTSSVEYQFFFHFGCMQIFLLYFIYSLDHKKSRMDATINISYQMRNIVTLRSFSFDFICISLGF